MRGTSRLPPRRRVGMASCLPKTAIASHYPQGEGQGERCWRGSCVSLGEATVSSLPL